MEQNKNFLETASYPQLLLRLSVPAIVIMMVMIIYHMADTFFIGQTGDPAKIAAISLCSPVFNILTGFGTLLGSGGCTVISLALGRNDMKKIKACAAFCFMGTIVFGLIFMSIVLSAARPIASALGADISTLTYTCDYLSIIAIGAPFLLFSNIFANIVRADGATVISMAANILGTVANITLDALFILVFHWDVAGAALATVIGNILSCIFLLIYMLKKSSMYALNPKYISWQPSAWLPVITLGIPMACSNFLMSFSNLFSNKLMIAHGTDALAAQNVTGKVGMLVTMLVMGLCMGLQPAISYAFAGNHKMRLNSILKKTAIFTICLGSGITLLLFIFRNQLIQAFIDNETIISYGKVMILAPLITGPFYGIYQLCQTFLQSTGKSSYATLTAFLDKGIIFIPVIFIMNLLFGLYGIVFASAVTLLFSLIIAVILSLRWKKHISSL